MEKLIIKIGASKDLFCAYSENCEGIWAGGETLEACKADVQESIRLIKEDLPEDRWPEPIKGEYELEWKYDVQSILLYYANLITLSGLQKLTGIHQKQLWSYMHGASKPREKQVMRIQEGLRQLGTELSGVQLY